MYSVLGSKERMHVCKARIDNLFKKSQLAKVFGFNTSNSQLVTSYHVLSVDLYVGEHSSGGSMCYLSLTFSTLIILSHANVTISLSLQLKSHTYVILINAIV